MADEKTNDLAALFEKSIPEENKTKLASDDWERFCAALDAPPQDHPRMRELLARPAFWEEQHTFSTEKADQDE